MREEKSILFVILVIVLGIAILYLFTLLIGRPIISLSPGSCDSSQTIMTLSSATNAHAGFWNSLYPIKICYPDIFGQNYNAEAGIDPHACKTDIPNSVILLTGDLNAHTGSSSGDYVCYGNLDCQIKNSGNCPSGYNLVISASSQTNGHFSSGNDYPVKVCCKNAQNNNYCGDGVCDVSNGENTNTCSQDCHLNTCGLGTTLCSDGTCKPVCDNFNCNNNQICEAGEGCQCGDCAGVQDSCEENLVCSASTKTCQEYSPPQINITNPLNSNNPDEWKKFQITQSINFEQVTYASKDLSINWTFGDLTSQKLINCLTTGNCNTTHSYFNQAHYIITANAKEQNGNGEANDFTNILVYKQGINVFAIISNPEYNSQIEQGTVYFNANKSFVAMCNSICDAGQSCYQVGSLYCYNFASPPSGYKMWFEWTFDPGMNDQMSLLGTWNENYSQVVEFNRIFISQGQHFASLRVGYDSS
jgi:hypothetical protein